MKQSGLVKFSQNKTSVSKLIQNRFRFYRAHMTYFQKNIDTAIRFET